MCNKIKIEPLVVIMQPLGGYPSMPRVAPVQEYPGDVGTPNFTRPVYLHWETHSSTARIPQGGD